MEGTATSPLVTPRGWRLPLWLWLPALAAIFAWHAWLTLALFGPDPLVALLDDRPIIQGSAPQHLYLGSIGAEALRSSGHSCAYDTKHLSGYPKTPIFDGSRPAEIFLLLGGGGYRPAAYKIGVAASCQLVPLLLFIACRGAGLDRVATLLALILGEIVWWGPLGRSALEAGDSVLYLAALAGLAHVGLLIAFQRRPSIRAWLGLLLTGCLGWFLQPLLFPIALPLLLAYYLSVGPRHDFLTWHIAFWLAEVGALVVNLGWLVNWFAYWWLRAPLPSATALLQQRTLGALWNAPLWGGASDRLFIVVLMTAAAAGVLVFNQTQQRCTARLLGMGAGGALVLALLGISWEPLGLVGTAALLAPALWFAALPAAHAWTCLARLPWAHGSGGRAASVLLLTLPLAAIALSGSIGDCLLSRCVAPGRLTIGLNAEREEIVKELVRKTTAEARILWEDRPLPRQASRWPALLPLLTGRQFIGGLDPDGFLEHSSICLANQNLEGRPIATWSDEELSDYCRRYNIGWIAAWSPNVVARLGACERFEKLSVLRDEDEGILFAVKERTGNIALRGAAELVHADSRYILLGDLVPDNGVVVLSLHYQAGMRASPGRVQVEREQSGDDPIGFIRLRLAAPAACVALSWDR
jgi:hypothetical protein